jgi:hypothetical protein
MLFWPVLIAHMHATICLSCLHTGIVGPVLGPEFGIDVPRCKPVATPGESFLPAELLAGSEVVLIFLVVNKNSLKEVPHILLRAAFQQIKTHSNLKKSNWEPSNKSAHEFSRPNCWYNMCLFWSINVRLKVKILQTLLLNNESQFPIRNYRHAVTLSFPWPLVALSFKEWSMETTQTCHCGCLKL